MMVSTLDCLHFLTIACILIQGPVVESKTMTGTKKHKRGTVEARIVKANIPVQNGIVSYLQKPVSPNQSRQNQFLDQSEFRI